MNDRSLRKVVIGLGGKLNSMPREDSFQITVASEVMAVLCLAHSTPDLKNRLGSIMVAKTTDDRPVFASDLAAQGAMAALLKDAVKPNLVQTLEGTPALIHGGPFANIAHGCSSVRATQLALKLGDYCITEAGFGSDLGAEKFFDIKCRLSGLTPAAAVLVATVRALKYNGGQKKDDLTVENLSALEKGLCNLAAHIENLQGFGVNVVVALNRFRTDSAAEIDVIRRYCDYCGASFALSEVFAKGGEGGIELAEKVVAAAETPSSFAPLYHTDMPLKEKIAAIAKKVYGADAVNFTDAGKKALREAVSLGGDSLPVCIAKTQYSLSDDPSLLGRPKNFAVTVSDVKIMNGAGFAVVYTGDVMTMPGLPRIPSAEKIDIDENDHITGLF